MRTFQKKNYTANKRVELKRIKGLMKEHDYTQLRMAKKLKITITTLNFKLNGKCPLTADEIITMSELLKVSMGFLIRAKKKTKLDKELEEIDNAKDNIANK